MTTTFEELVCEVLRFRDEREWARFHTPKNLVMGLGIEDCTGASRSTAGAAATGTSSSSRGTTC
ncbi:hypothetical protein [Sandaracinus amylolyticus]|uniref:hypothetical protein n=1 Tax=Sandaracinus amylolyticus TaxID=927083 RepID=UPI001F33D46F|nr:hypothetical protein [Sandaracinus amylolyticus]